MDWAHLIELINHHAWIEHGDVRSGLSRLYVKWGHYPETDGKMEPSIVKDLIVKVNGIEVPAVIGIDKDSSARSSLFLEFPAKEGVYEIFLKYERGVFTVTANGSWVYGDYNRAKSVGYDLAYSVTVEGVAKTYLSSEGLAKGAFKPLGKGLELTPLSLECPKARILVTLNGKPLKTEIMHVHDGGKESVEGDKVDVELGPGFNVLLAKADLKEGDLQRRRIASTLTLRC